jgi:hypothetical protein
MRTVPDACQSRTDVCELMFGARVFAAPCSTAKVCMGTIKGVHYWVKEINGTFNQGTDGPMISKASALRLERVLKPHLQLLRDNRDECLQNPSTFFTYTMMSLRPALKETMRWVDASFKTYDDEVYAEMQSSKETFSRAGSIPKWQVGVWHGTLCPLPSAACRHPPPRVFHLPLRVPMVCQTPAYRSSRSAGRQAWSLVDMLVGRCACNWAWARGFRNATSQGPADAMTNFDEHAVPAGARVLE